MSTGYQFHPSPHAPLRPDAAGRPSVAARCSIHEREGRRHCRGALEDRERRRSPMLGPQELTVNHTVASV